MKAMVLNRTSSFTENPRPLNPAILPEPSPTEHEILIKISACGVCHTELDEIEGRMPPQLPIILGHQVIGTVSATGRLVKGVAIGSGSAGSILPVDNANSAAVAVKTCAPIFWPPAGMSTADMPNL